MTTPEKPRRLTPPGRGLLWSHLAATLLTVAEFVLLQAVAIGLTTVVYWIAPELDAKAQPGFTEWLRVFQIVSPTLTVSGGAAIVISSYIYAKRAQEYYEIAAQADARAERERERAAEDRKLAAEERERSDRERERAAEDRERADRERERAERDRDRAEAEVARLTARIAQLENGNAVGSA